MRDQERAGPSGPPPFAIAAFVLFVLGGLVFGGVFLANWKSLGSRAPTSTQRTIASDFGIKVDYYARVDFRGFEQMIDAVNGVVVDVERPIKDDEYPTEDYGYQRLYVTPGPQWMDGPTALKYARSRHDST